MQTLRLDSHYLSCRTPSATVPTLKYPLSCVYAPTARINSLFSSGRVLDVISYGFSGLKSHFCEVSWKPCVPYNFFSCEHVHMRIKCRNVLERGQNRTYAMVRNKRLSILRLN